MAAPIRYLTFVISGFSLYYHSVYFINYFALKLPVIIVMNNGGFEEGLWTMLELWILYEAVNVGFKCAVEMSEVLENGEGLYDVLEEGLWTFDPFYCFNNLSLIVLLKTYTR